MGQQHDDDVFNGAYDARQQRGKLLPMARQPGVDDGESPPVLEDVPVDVVIPETVDAVRDL